MKKSTEYVPAHMAETRKNNNRMTILTYVIFALVATIIFSTSTLSRYTAKVQSFDEATVVTTIILTEDVYSDGESTIVQAFDIGDIYPGGTVTKYIKIRSADPNLGDPFEVSNIAQNYSIEVSTLGIIPELQLELSSYNMASGSRAGLFTSGEIATVDEGYIQGGDNSNIYKLDITWPEKYAAQPDLGGRVDRITIRVTYDSEYNANSPKDINVGTHVQKLEPPAAPIKAGDEVFLTVTMEEYLHGYAGISLNRIYYDNTVLQFDGFEYENGYTDFTSGMFYEGSTAISMIASPSTADEADGITGGVFVNLKFIALTDITEATSVSVGFDTIAVFTEGQADNWTNLERAGVTVESGGIFPN